MSFVHRHVPDAAPDSHDVCLVLQADRLLARPDVSGVVTLPEFSAVAGWRDITGSPLHIGQLNDVRCWLLAVDNADASAADGWQWHDTRSIIGVLSAEQFQAVSCARQLHWWDRRHRFCGACGSATSVMAEERAKRCPKCGAVFFPAVSPAIIVAVTRGDELLLAHNKNFRPGMFSLLAGFVDPGETLEQAVVREVVEEVGIEVGDLRYVTSQPWSFPNSLMIGFRARHLSGELCVDGKEIHEAGWFRRDALPEVPRVGTVSRQLIDLWVAAVS